MSQWTAKQARYQPTTLHIDGGPDRLTRHYTLTRHGAVARTFVGAGSLIVEVVLWRRRNRHPQYQGSVRRSTDGTGYTSYDATGREIATAADYINAEAPLLPLRTRHRSRAAYTWPSEILRKMREAASGVCDICGTPLKTNECPRPDLHWTTASLARPSTTTRQPQPAD